MPFPPSGAAGGAPSGQPLISRPLILIGAPRSGTTMLFQALSAHPALWSLYRESQPILDAHFPVSMAPGSSALVTADATDDKTAADIKREFFERVGNLEGGSGVLSRSLPLILRSR